MTIVCLFVIFRGWTPVGKDATLREREAAYEPGFYP
jgi:hypothetical protein